MRRKTARSQFRGDRASPTAESARNSPTFHFLHGRHVPVCVYAFDLMEHEGRYLREEPTRADAAPSVSGCVRAAWANLIRFIDSFTDPIVLPAECIRLSLEGIVCKRKDAPYRSGARSGWIKVKCEGWKAANKWRGEFFEKQS